MSARSYRRLTATATITLFTVVACHDSTTPAAPMPPDARVSDDAAPSQLDVARTVPGFGGYYIDPVKGPTVYLTDLASRPDAERALGGWLSGRGQSKSDLQVLFGSYTYQQLEAWYRLARPAVFAIPGFVLGDVDEGQNRIRIGVTDAAASLAVRSAFTLLGVPSGAVMVQVRSPIAAMATLRDRVRPLQGGLQINFFPTDAGTPGPSLICTLGFNVELDGVRSFITNSHCTNVEGGTMLTTQYYQNLRSGGAPDFIGTEADDPEWQMNTPECPLPFACRYSDAARVQYDAGAEVTLGTIAEIDGMTTSLDDTTHTIIGTFIIGAERDPIQGEVARKVGRTTGYTAGFTTGTCVDVLALGTTHIRLCQTVVAALVDGGDSGSPVFYSDGNIVVTLLGILWGGSTDDANPEFVYSPISGVKRELGNFRAF
ncbi:MAG TPA: hypothetical protein VFO82_12180 [Steroidobacteraceae bacterium]|nr:hypothetical protein [Steroidobacteraceae bacterium]